MSVSRKKLQVKKSRLPKAGKGLFAKQDIKKGERIVEYRGRIRTWKESDTENNGLLFYVNSSHVIDARPYKKAVARFANDAYGLSRIPGTRNNAYYEQDKLRIYITALRNIKAGEEILVGYGKDYWDAMRHNTEIEKGSIR